MKKLILISLLVASCSKQESILPETEGITLQYYNTNNVFIKRGQVYQAYDTINNRFINGQEYSIKANLNTNIVSIKSDKIITNVRVFCEGVNYTVNNSSNTVSFEVDDYNRLNEFKSYINVQLTYINN